MTTRRRDTKVNLLRAGVLAAGFGAALVVGPAVASADDGDGRDNVTAGPESAATARPHSTSRRGATSPADAPTRPAASRVASRADTSPARADALETQVPEPVSSAATGEAAAAPKATLAADPGPIQSAVLAAQAYIYGYPLMEYERVRQTVGTAIR